MFEKKGKHDLSVEQDRQRHQDYTNQYSLGDLDAKRHHEHTKGCACYNERVGETAYRDESQAA